MSPLEMAARSGAREIYCTHGPDSFADHLREAGFEAYPLNNSYQYRLS